MDVASEPPVDPLKSLIQVLRNTVPVARSTIGYSYVPRVLQTPATEITKAMISGVDCDEVYPNIFVGDEGSARNKVFLQAFGITHVMNTAEGTSFGQVNTGAAYYSDVGIKYLGLDLLDIPQTKISNYFDEGVSFIESAITSNGKILVHCLMGLSRSTTFAAAYLISKKNMTTEEALYTIRKQREVFPNDGFLVQLLQLEKKVHT